MRKPTYRSRLFRDLQFSFSQLLKQQNDLNMWIEWERVDKNNPQLGTLPALIHPFLSPEPYNKSKKNEPRHFYMLNDLNPLIPNDMSQQLASSMLYFAATNIGKPLLINMVKLTLESLAVRLGAKLYKIMYMNGEGIHEFIQLNGLAYHTTNYT